MMQLVITTLLLIGAASAVSAAPDLAPLSPLEENEITIPNEYIVIFKKEASEVDVMKHMKFVDVMMLSEPNDTYSVQNIYHMGPNFRGYHALMNEHMLRAVRGMDEVEYVERNQWGEWADTYTKPDLRICRNQPSTNANWALSRISHINRQSPPLTYRYDYLEEGIGVNIYIVDSGIDTTNPDFGGRARWGINTAGGPHIDVVGHGTNVAGCAMSNTYGSARRGTAIAVRIDRDHENRPDTALAIAGFQWVRNNQKRGKSIANASFSVGSAVNGAVNALIDSGVPVVVAAGNANRDACSSHPASVPRAITVAASDRNDNFASFSNYGNCVDMIAPGVQIQTTGKNNQNPTTTSGTSFSAPYTAGIIAAILELKDMQTSLNLFHQRLLSNKIHGVKPNTPNRLLNNHCS